MAKAFKKILLIKIKIMYFLLWPARVVRERRLRLRLERFDKFYKHTFDNVVGGSIVVNVKDMPGAFEIGFRSHILRRILEKKQYEPEMVTLIKNRIDPKKDVVDVGANIGLYTILFSKLINSQQKVLSIEPTPTALEYLYKNIVRNDCSKSVIVYEGIATSHKGDFQLNVISGMEEYSSLGNIVHPSVQDKSFTPITISGDTIDSIVERFHLAPGFLKIDTEGSEYHVLQGALGTLQKYRPIIVSELSDRLLSSVGTNSEMVMKLLKDNGYSISSLENPDSPINIPFDGEIIAICLYK